MVPCGRATGMKMALPASQALVPPFHTRSLIPRGSRSGESVPIMPMPMPEQAEEKALTLVEVTPGKPMYHQAKALS